MEKFFIDHTEDTPRVELNQEENIYEISGKSLPENAIAFYLPIITWLKEYNRNHSESIIFDIRLDYFNTASAKQITKLLLVLQDLSETIDIKVRWFYLEEDTDILSSGLRFSRLIKVKIELIVLPD